ncbi:hypothetical protein CNR22_01900 [Sphingobacteriaceae bacterium]|nr:hypothetical protein CNR22_01900 [Sphingobacteriaceae bacterium]
MLQKNKMLKQEAIKQLLSVQSILSQIKDEDYTSALTTLKGASIGKHIRHIVEFYECLLFNTGNTIVNYDTRKRNLLLEENVKYTEDFITEIIDTLMKIEGNTRVLLVSNYQDQNITMESSVYREITYNIEHTVHHLAIISIVIPLHFNYINLSANFGYADSTIQYLKSHKVI